MSLIKVNRLKKGYTQKELAEAVGVSQVVVCQWESGTVFPRPKTFVRLCEVLEVSADELLKDRSANVGDSDRDA